MSQTSQSSGQGTDLHIMSSAGGAQVFSPCFYFCSWEVIVATMKYFPDYRLCRFQDFLTTFMGPWENSHMLFERSQLCHVGNEMICLKWSFSNFCGHGIFWSAWRLNLQTDQGQAAYLAEARPNRRTPSHLFMAPSSQKPIKHFTGCSLKTSTLNLWFCNLNAHSAPSVILSNAALIQQFWGGWT